MTTGGPEGYGAPDTAVLKRLEVARKRPGMYIGLTGERGLHHLVYEVVGNSVDEVLVGYADHIEVTILEDGGSRVVDNSRGIPINEHPSEHKPIVEVVMMILRAGGKFSGGGYAVSGGLRGVGTSIVNAPLARVDTIIRCQGYAWRMFFADGGYPIIEPARGEAIEEAGTTQTFCPNPKIFETTVFSFETLRQHFQQMAFPSKDLHITLTDEQPTAVDDGDEIIGDESDTADDPVPGHHAIGYMYEHGLHDCVKCIDSTKKNDVVNAEIIDLELGNNEGTMSIEIAMQWTTAYSFSVRTFANTISTTGDDTHEEGFRTALTTLVNRYERGRNTIKDKDDNFTGDDIHEGLTAITSIKLSEPQSEGQMKTKLGSTETHTFVQQQVYSQLDDWLDAHPAEARVVTQKNQQAQAARVATRKTYETTRRKDVLESVSVPGKLRDCPSCKAEDYGIPIVEGDSAGGSTVGGRDPKHQVTMPIRGKILSAEKTHLGRALSSDTIRFLITVFGTGTGEDLDLNKLRYGKIVIMADADAGGQHIATLPLILLFRYVRPLIEQGHTYIAIPPLYRIKWTSAKHEFAYFDKEYDKLLTAGQFAGHRLLKGGGIQRYKGLGEMNDHELWETTTDPVYRILEQATLDEMADMDEVLVILMGGDVNRRRSFVRHNTSDARFLDI